MPGDADDLAIFNWLKQISLMPGTGTSWIRAVRQQQDMLAKQLAKIMQVSPARISVLEKDEQRGAVTLNMMHKAADALDCQFVYALIPKSSQQAVKPRIRLDSAHMKEGKERQVHDLQLQYEHSVVKTTRN